MFMRLIFIRHGETQINVEGKMHIKGSSSELTKIGINQILSTIAFLNKNNVEKVYSSPTKRTYQSAKLISEKLNISLDVLDDLKERDWGNWETKTWNEISIVLDKMSLNERYEFIPPHGESWKQMEERLKVTLKKVTDGSEKCVCIVTHMGALRGLIPILKNQDKSVSLNFSFDNGSITIFDFKDNKYREIIINDTSHLNNSKH